MSKPIIRRSFCVLAAFLLFLPPLAARAALPAALESLHFDWVCVTDASLVSACAPLAAHREAQGLAALILPLDEVIRWSPAGDDTVATLRWLAGTAVTQWGARYLLIGGSHALLPAPVHRLEALGDQYDHPVDAYYACLDGEWDADGDGLVAEWGEDAADPTVHLRVGRLPADGPQTVSDVVAKILAFEKRPVVVSEGVLFVSSLMDPMWDGTRPYPNAALGAAIALRDAVAAQRPALRIGSLFQGPESVDPWGDTLNPVAFADSLRLRPHDLVHIQLNGIARAWELASGLQVTGAAFDSVAGCGHFFLASMVSGWTADTRDDCILQHLLTLPGGGAAGVIAPAGMGYLSPYYGIQTALWSRLVDEDVERLGDALFGALNAFAASPGLTHPVAATSYWNMTLLGDPATLLRPLGSATSGVPEAARPADVHAVPNPFNPETTIAFTVDGGDGGLQPVRVEVFDLQGRRLGTLLETRLLPGPHAVGWRAEAPGGLYFARVTVSGRTKTVKLTLVK